MTSRSAVPGRRGYRTPTECHRLATIAGSVVSLRRIRPTVRSVSSGFSVDIMGLQVTGDGPDARVVTVTGEIDVVTAPDLADCLTTQLAGSQVVVVDLDGVRFLGSAGVAVLFEANELATRQGRDLQLVSHSRAANLALKVTGLCTCFTFANSVPDALNHVV
jgi:anti-sigma B factor antagonist